MKIRTYFSVLSCFALAACAATSSGEVPGSPGTWKTADARPGAENKVVIRLADERKKSTSFTFDYSYPPYRTWMYPMSRCVNEHSKWSTFINFDHERPEVRIRATAWGKAKCSTPPLVGMGHIVTGTIHFDRGAIEGKVLEVNGRLELCAKQVADQDFRCEFMRRPQ
jgi:hypothetical protein